MGTRCLLCRPEWAGGRWLGTLNPVFGFYYAEYSVLRIVLAALDPSLILTLVQIQVV